MSNERPQSAPGDDLATATGSVPTAHSHDHGPGGHSNARTDHSPAGGHDHEHGPHDHDPDGREKAGHEHGPEERAPHSDHDHGASGHDHGDHDHGAGGHDHGGHGHDHGPDGHDHEHATGIRGFVLSIFKPHSHDAADSIDSALESNAEGIRALKISLIALLITAVLQLAVVIITGSVALLADTIHNFSDALTAIPLWIAFVLARRAANRRYSYGYGRFEDLAGLFIVAMIALSSIIAGYESVRRLIHPQNLDNVWVVFAAGLIGFIGNELVAVYRIRVGRKIGSAALVADGLHARTDGFTSIAVAIGAVGVLAGFRLADPIVGILITIAILFVLRGAARDIYRRLMDAIEPSVMDAAETTLRQTPGVVDVDELRMRWLGHQIRAEVGLVVAEDLDLPAAHEISENARHRLLHEVSKLADATVRVSPRGRDGHPMASVAGHHERPPVPPAISADTQAATAAAR